MRFLRRGLDRLQPLFSRGGRLEKYSALFEMVDTLLFSPADKTRGAPHVRDAIDLKRVMIYVVIARHEEVFSRKSVAIEHLQTGQLLDDHITEWQPTRHGAYWRLRTGHAAGYSGNAIITCITGT